MNANLSSEATNADIDVSVALFSSRETVGTLVRSVAAALRALEGFNAVLDVVVNGNPALAGEFADYIRNEQNRIGGNVRVRCWSLACGDKAHALNTHIHVLWPVARTTVFIDGYVEIDDRSIVQLDKALAENPDALGATGVPTVGHSATRLRHRMTTRGGIHGNLFALCAGAMHTIRRIGFFLPLGLYRGDPMIGAALCKRFEPAGQKWDPQTIIVLPDVSWRFEPLRWWRPKDIVTHFKRMSRQHQGRLENLAFRNFFIRRQQGLDKLPRTVLEMIETWIDAAPEEAAEVLERSSAVRRALERLRSPRDWSSASEPPRMLFETRGGDIARLPRQERDSTN